MRATIIKTRNYPPHIAGDELSLKISSYPVAARYLAGRLSGEGDSVCELCCGIGVSLAELSKNFDKATGVDSDKKTLDYCRKNLELAGAKNCQLIHGDVSDLELLGKIKAGVVLYDIPYWSDHGGKVSPDKQNPDLPQLIANIRELITDKIVIYTPAHTMHEEAAAKLGPCEFTEVYINGKHDRNFIFLGDLAKQPGKSRIELYAI